MRSGHKSIPGSTPWRRGAAVLGVAIGLMMLLAGCGGGTSGSGTSTTGGNTSITCPPASTVTSWHLVQSGQLTVGTDTTYAPAEFVDPAHPGQYIGYDIEIANEIGRRLCLTTKIDKFVFDDARLQEMAGPTLGQQRWDMSISSWTIKPARLALVHMIPYFQAGESILVPKGNPKNIKTINDMCGKIVGVQDGTSEQAELNDANGTGDGTSGQASVCQSNKIRLYVNSDQNLVAQQVQNGSADASYQDQPVTDYYVKQFSSQLESGGITVAPSPQGIPIRKDNPDLESAIRGALKAMVADGTYQKILNKWGVGAGAYTSQL